MKLQTKAPDRRSAQPPSRTAARAVRAEPAPKHQQADHDQPHGRGRRCDGRSRRSRLRPGPDRRSGRPERSTPPFALTLRADELGSATARPVARAARFRASVSACSAGIGLLSGLAQAERLEWRSQYEPTLPDRHRRMTAPTQNEQHRRSASVRRRTAAPKRSDSARAAKAPEEAAIIGEEVHRRRRRPARQRRRHGPG